MDENGYGDFGSRHYFFDYDLKVNTFTGLDLIEHHGLALESLLISGLAGESEIHDRTKRLGVSCLRKDFRSDIPIIASVDLIWPPNFHIVRWPHPLSFCL